MNKYNKISFPILLGISASLGAPYIQEDTLELKTLYPDSSARTIYKGTWLGKIIDLELHDPGGIVLLKKENLKSFEGISYFSEPTYEHQVDLRALNKEIDLLVDSLQQLKIKVDKVSKASGSLMLWINGDGLIEHAVWYRYIGLTKLFMKKSMVYAENWRIKPEMSGTGIVLHRRVEFK